MGMLSLAQLLGFIIGPAIQASLSPIGEKPLGEGPISAESTFHFDMYTACGYELNNKTDIIISYFL